MTSTVSIDQVAKYVHMTPTERAVFDYLAARLGQFVETSRLTDSVYALDPDGGPEWAAKVIQVANCNLRKKLRAYGLCITGYGGRNGGQTRLHWLEVS